MVVISPLFYYFFTYLKAYGLVIITLAYLSAIEAGIAGMSSTAIMYFGLGAYLGIQKANVLKFCLRFGKALGAFALIALGFTTYYTADPINEYFVRIFVLTALPSVFMIALRLRTNNVLKRYLTALSPSVFFIYATHSIYILGKLKGMFMRTSLAESNWGMLLGYFLIPCICIFVVLMIYHLMRRYIPKTLSFITGSRG